MLSNAPTLITVGGGAVAAVVLQRTAAEYERHYAEYKAAMADFRQRNKGRMWASVLMPFLAIFQGALFISQFSAISVLTREKVCCWCALGSEMTALVCGCSTQGLGLHCLMPKASSRNQCCCFMRTIFPCPHPVGSCE